MAFASFASISQLLRRMTWKERIHYVLYIDYQPMREGVAELYATTLYMTIGLAANAQAILEKTAKPYTLLSTHVAWCLGLMYATLISHKVSGAQLHPGISMIQAIRGHISIYQLAINTMAQYLGGIFGSAIVYAIYYDGIRTLANGNYQIEDQNDTASIFILTPQNYTGALQSLGDQILSSAIYVACYIAIRDSRSNNTDLQSTGALSLLTGLLPVMIGLSFAYNCGGIALNPIRDLSPRIFIAMAGWGTNSFSNKNYWFWIPFVGTYVGSLVGTLSYEMAIGLHWPNTIIVNSASLEENTTNRSFNKVPPLSSKDTSLEMNAVSMNPPSNGEITTIHRVEGNYDDNEEPTSLTNQYKNSCIPQKTQNTPLNISITLLSVGALYIANNKRCIRSHRSAFR